MATAETSWETFVFARSISLNSYRIHYYYMSNSCSIIKKIKRISVQSVDSGLSKRLVVLMKLIVLSNICQNFMREYLIVINYLSFLKKDLSQTNH